MMSLTMKALLTMMLPALWSAERQLVQVLARARKRR
jgi:hypothetical protein